MSYKYIGTPKNISFSECRENNYVFAPSKYTRFLPHNEWLFVPMSQICTESKIKIDIKRKNEYNYTEIGDIDVSSGIVNHTHCYGIDLPSENPKQCICGDILISTVRTYRGGVGMITEELSNHCCSPAILVIREVAQIITKEYLLAILKTDFFIEQILGFQTRGMYPRLDSDAMKKVLIPIPKNVDTIKFVSVLQRSFLNKNSLIRQRHADILQLIEKELTENQKPNKFNYHLPRLNEVKKIGRLDTGIYGDTFLRQKHLLTNYKYDYCNFLSLNNNNVVISRGQNLQESNIGKSIYTNNQIKGYYTLCLSKHFTQCQTITQFLYLGNKLSLKTINEGEIIFSCRGEMGRLLIFCDQVEKTITNIDNVHIEFPNQDLFKNIYIAQILSYLKEKGFIKSIAITGSGADSFTKYQFDMLPIPNFPESKQKEIAALYHNPQEYVTDQFTLDNFEEKDNVYNLTAGIYELDKTAKRLKEKLNKAIDDIVNDRDVKIEF